MTAKKVAIKKKPTAARADEWVGERKEETQTKGKAKAKEAPEELTQALYH